MNISKQHITKHISFMTLARCYVFVDRIASSGVHRHNLESQTMTSLAFREQKKEPQQDTMQGFDLSQVKKEDFFFDARQYEYAS